MPSNVAPKPAFLTSTNKTRGRKVAAVIAEPISHLRNKKVPDGWPEEREKVGVWTQVHFWKNLSS